MATATIIRLKCDRAFDLQRGQILARMVRACATTFQVGLFNGADVEALAGVASVTLLVKDSPRSTDAPLMSKTVATGSLTPCTGVQWTNGTGQHAAFSFTNAECNLAMSTERSEFYIVVKTLLNSGAEVVFAVGKLILHDANASAVGDPPENPEPGISGEQVHAMIDAVAVRYDGPQTLTLEQRIQALTNLGITLEQGKITFPNGSFIFLNTPEP